MSRDASDLATPDAMTRLKAETRELHASTERTALARAMARGEMTRAQYALQLEAYLAIHEALEAALRGSSDARVQAVYEAEMVKVPSLVADLKALTVDPTPPTREAFELFAATAQARALVTSSAGNGARLLGMLYVMEGSTLGASFLLPRLREAMSLRPEESSYYAGYGPSARARWGAFAGRMNAAVHDAASQDAAVDAARELFTRLGAIFDAISHAAHSHARVA